MFCFYKANSTQTPQQTNTEKKRPEKEKRRLEKKKKNQQQKKGIAPFRGLMSLTDTTTIGGDEKMRMLSL
jgi:hypothetical protein